MMRFSATLLLLGGVLGTSAAPSSTNCALVCSLLAVTLLDKVSFPNSTVYTLETANYWSDFQSAQVPTCRISPSCAEDVSITLKALVHNSCQFAVKSGGHASFAGASNIDSGVTIDLVNMDSVMIENDGSQVSVGTGARWGQIYSAIEGKGVAVVGGRNSEIGAGGLTLGGGVSFFSGLKGFGCDNVNNYEVVFADGSVNNVNLATFPDLYFALRGGGNNFGIVTRLDLAAFPQGDLWGGSFNYNITEFPALVDAFTKYNIDHAEDPSAAVILSYVWVGALGTYFVNMDLEYAKPIPNPVILQPFTNIPNLSNTARITNLTDLTDEIAAAQPIGSFESFWVLMIHNNAQLLLDINEIWVSEINAILDVADFLPDMTMQPISTAITSHFTENGGNALGITAADGPLTMINTSIKWSSPLDSDRVLAAAQNFVNRSTALAKSRGLHHRYIYQNYAAIQQDVFTGYGEVNKRRLAQIHAKYDPGNVFTKLQPGYFKVTSA